MDSFTLSKIEFNEVRRVLSGFCSCSLGKALAIRVNPSRSPETVGRWLRQVSQMVEAVRDVSLPPFGGVTDIRQSLGRAHPSSGATGEDFAAIADTLDAAANIKRYLNALPERLDTLHALAGEIGSFDGEVNAIRAIVEADGTVRDNASERLSRLRLEIQATSRKIHDLIYGYLQDKEVAKLLQNATVTLHGDRYVLPVKADNRGRLPGVVHRASNTGATVFVEPNACVELNNHLADLSVDERREIERLLNTLAIRIQGRTDEMAATLHTLAQIDLITAKAQYAYQFDMTAPEVSERGDLQFIAARHPLLLEQAEQQKKQGVPELERHPVVPIDIRLGSDFDLLVITGSNTGGKTVALKTVALLAVMAQSGMHIPAQRGARMPVFRDVYVDIGDEQSLQQSLSTFGAHVKRARYILHKADKACLVLLDELGAGTDPDEGGAIGQAILDELTAIGCLGMVTTHLSVLKAYALNHERVDNASVEFDTKTMSPTYHVRIGTPGESHAITVASRLGLPKRIISAARRHMSGQGKQFRRAIRATGQARQVAEEARAQAVQAELAAKTQQETYESKLADLHRLQSEFEHWLMTLGELRPGDEVAVPSLNKAGRLVRLELHRQIAVVEAGGIQVEVPLTQLMPDLGQSAVREQIAALRKQILDQAGATEQIRAEAEHTRQQYHRSLQQQKQRARQFDMWLGALGRVKVGDVVPIARRPGKAKVLSVDLLGLRATVETGRGEMTISIQDLFPQSGPFARRAPRETREQGQRRGERREEARGKGRGEARGARQETRRQRGERTRRQPPPDKNRPMDRGHTTGRSASAKREAVLALQPGQKVFVVPFHKRATLIRLVPEKGVAVVQSGVFEMEIPLSDLEPTSQPAPKPKKPPTAKPAKPKPHRPKPEPKDTPPVVAASAEGKTDEKPPEPAPAPPAADAGADAAADAEPPAPAEGEPPTDAPTPPPSTDAPPPAQPPTTETPPNGEPPDQNQ